MGHFLPVDTYRDLVDSLAESLFDKGEVETARKQVGGRTLAEIWQAIGKNNEITNLR